MWEKLHDMQLRQFLINELEKNECSCRKKAALIIGKQPESDVYVFSDSVQVRNTQINNKVHIPFVDSFYFQVNFSFPLFQCTLTHTKAMENSNLTGKINCNIYKGLEFSNVRFTDLKFVIPYSPLFSRHLNFAKIFQAHFASL